MIYCANCGDSRAITLNEKSIERLSFDHKVSIISERERIIKAGGSIKGDRICD